MANKLIKQYIVTQPTRTGAGPQRVILRKEFFDRYYTPGTSLVKLAEEWGITRDLLYRSLERLGIKAHHYSMKKALPEREIVRDYRAGMTVNKLMNKYGSHWSRLRAVLMAHGIVPKGRGKPSQSPRFDETIKRMYYSAEPYYEIKDIEKALGMSKPFITRRIIAMNLIRRTDPRHPRNVYMNNRIKHYYLTERKSLEQVAKILHVNDETVRNRLHKMGIELRSPGGKDMLFVAQRNALFKKLYDEGVPLEEIYKQTGVKIKKKNQLRRMGITPNRQVKRHLPKDIFEKAIEYVFTEKKLLTDAARKYNIRLHDGRLDPQSIKYHLVKIGKYPDYINMKRTLNLAPLRSDKKITIGDWERDLKISKLLIHGYKREQIANLLKLAKSVVYNAIWNHKLYTLREPAPPEGVTPSQAEAVRKRVNEELERFI